MVPISEPAGLEQLTPALGETQKLILFVKEEKNNSWKVKEKYVFHQRWGEGSRMRDALGLISRLHQGLVLDASASGITKSLPGNVSS